jgi:hypothetical protein
MNHPTLKDQWVLIGDSVKVSLPPMPTAKDTKRTELTGMVTGLELPDPLGDPAIVKVQVTFPRKPRNQAQTQWVYLSLSMVKPSELDYCWYVTAHTPENGK